MRYYSALLIALIVLVSFNFSFISVSFAISDSSSSPTFATIIKKINITAIDQHIKYLSSLGSRFTGYPGYDIATEYIYGQLAKYCDLVQCDLYNITIPVDYGAKIVSPLGKEIQAYAFLPNLVQTSITPKEGLTGKLVYVGKGYPSEIEGKSIEGNIVLMEFNSRDNWIDIASLGAKAVIFIEPQETVTAEADLKYLRHVPLPFTRLYVKKEAAAELMALALENREITIFSRMVWEERTANNIVGVIWGTDPYVNETVIVSAYYDASSVVPGVAPGANEAIGISVLMEFAKFLNQNRPRRTTIFIAFSGHAQGLAGARNFVMKVLRNREYLNFMRPLILASVIDLSSETNKIALLYTENFYGKHWGWEDSPTIYWLQDFFITKMTEKIGSAWEELYQKTYDVFGSQSFYLTGLPGEEIYSPLPYISEIGIFTVCGVAPVLFRTAYASYHYLSTPIDTYEKVNLENIRPQVEYIFCSLYSFLNLERHGITTSFRRALGEQAPSVSPAFGSLTGQISEYIIEKNIYVPVSKALVFVAPSSWTMRRGFNHYIITMTDENGIFYIPGLALNWWYTLYGYKIDSEGSLIYAPDLGLYGANRYPNNFYTTGDLGSYETPRNFVVFKCGSIILYKFLANFYAASSFGLGSTTEEAFTSLSPAVNIINAESKASEIFFGYNTQHNILMVYVKEGNPVQILVSIPGFLSNLYLNASKTNPLGNGYVVKTGETISINILQNAWDLFLINDFRFSIIHKFNIFTGVEIFHKNNGEALKNAEKCLQENRLGDFYKNTLDVWGKENLVYRSINIVLQDTVYATVLYYILLIPFAFIFERVIFNFRENTKRYIAVAIIFSLMVLFLYFFHPGFQIASSVLGIILGFTILIFSLPLLLIVISKLIASLTSIRRKVFGYHFAEIDRAGAFGISFSVGLSGLRRHKTQASLVIASIVLINIAIVSFTTMAPFIAINVYSASGQATYKGIFLRDVLWQSLSQDFVKYLEARFIRKALVSPRAWWYPRFRELGIPVYSQTSQTNLQCVLGFSWREVSRDFSIADAILPGGRWFVEGDYKVCILPSNVASMLNVSVNDEVEWMGLNLKVVGILDCGAASMVFDLDQSRPAPLNPRVLPRIIFHDLSDALIVPYDLLVDLFGDVHTIAIIFPEDTPAVIIEEEAKNLAAASTICIYMATEVGGKINYLSTARGILASGYQFILAPLAILACIIFTMMIGVINQRNREMLILSSVGLSPIHIAGIFLSEAISYAFIGSVIGYTASIPLINALNIFHLLPPEIYPNYSSRYVMLAILITMMAILASSFYPLVLSTKIVTPSLMRRWRIESRPINDKWQIPLPFTFSQEEMVGLRAFLKEFFENNITMEMGAPFVTLNLSKFDHAEDKTLIKGLKASVHIAPFSLGIHQEVEIILSYDTSANQGKALVICTRLKGMKKDWESSNRSFIDAVRKQFLIWRSLDPIRRKEYIQRD